MPPGWDGIETIDSIIQVDRDIQIVICTAYADYVWEDIHEKFGARDNILFMRKPFDSTEVQQLACTLSEKWNLARQARMKVDELEAIADKRTRELQTSNSELQDAMRDLRRTQVQLIQSEKMASLGSMITGVAHEINTPIGAVASMHGTRVLAMDKLRTILEEDCAEDDPRLKKLEKMMKVIGEANRVISSGTERVTTIVKRLDDLLSSDDGRWRIVPIASNSTGTGAKFKFKPDPDGETQIYASSSWWLYGRQNYEMGAKNIKLPNNLIVSAIANYRIMPEERFYGYGMASTERDLLFYKYEYSDFSLAVGEQVDPHFRILGYGSFRVNNIHRTAKAPSVNVWVGDDVLNMVTGGMRVELNTVPNPAKPTGGTVMVWDLARHDDFYVGYGKLGKYWQVYNERVIYCDIEGSYIGANGSRLGLPFYDYPTLGGAENLRGYQRDRYRGDSLVAGTFEYRFPLRDIWGESGLDFHIFTDWGQVFMEDADNLNGNPQIGYGFGFDAWNSNASGIAFDVGFSREGVMVYLSMGL
ncbi:MAG TPA: hypothetical protein ENH10_07850 [Bacteroidetes bacterium]|nr:C4-dicarboxylate transport sensor protein DctB [bacterium BMS3Bbin04]HDO65925.1 hypothetical protein [Bacteroidota bacterium]HEX05050.1 hypothetical protein [Bacteroidota bacterium]